MDGDSDAAKKKVPRLNDRPGHLFGRLFCEETVDRRLGPAIPGKENRFAGTGTTRRICAYPHVTPAKIEVMPTGKYYRTQAQLFARLAVTSSDPQTTARYNEMALEQLAKAGEVEPGRGARAAQAASDTSRDRKRD
jgi:hypothetical protein